MASTGDFVLFAFTAVLFTLQIRAVRAVDTCDGQLLNSAFVFVKPHANTLAVQNLVRDKLVQAGIKILTEVDISGDEIDSKKLIDQHYYAIGKFGEERPCALLSSSRVEHCFFSLLQRPHTLSR